MPKDGVLAKVLVSCCSSRKELGVHEQFLIYAAGNIGITVDG